jgi:SAM-dependent methyltransferase
LLSEAHTPSPQLRAFVEDAPLEREHVLRFVQEAARNTPSGARVLDAGAGEAPYRELFAHCDYSTSDWEGSVHAGGRRADIVASLESLPVEDGRFHAVINTQVLEHVPDPSAVLSELARVLAPGGRLWLTVPFVGELHEEPYDFYRYTRYGLRELCERAGFEEVRVEPLTGYFTTVAQVMRNCGLSIGLDGERSDLRRRLIAAVFRVVARVMPLLDRFDDRRALPLGWTCRATRRA